MTHRTHLSTRDRVDSSTWYECRLHEPQERHSVRVCDTLGYAERLTSDGRVPLSVDVLAGEKACVEAAIRSGRLTDAHVVAASQITQETGAEQSRRESR